jgi:hypothetical protein
VPALLQAFLRLATLRWLGVLLCALAMTLGAASTASALEPAQTKTRIWGFGFAEHHSDGLLNAATRGKHRRNRLALSEVASGSLLAAEGLEPMAARAESALSGSLLNQQLAAEEIAGAQLPSEITGYTGHGLDQAISRDGVGVSVRAIGDAVRNPVSIFGRAPGAFPAGTFGFVGSDATVILNAQGEVVSTWATGSAGVRLGF